MSDTSPPTDKSPVFRTYSERRDAEARNRADANRRTHQHYRLPISKKKPVVNNPPRDNRYADPVPSAGNIPTRDMQPVPLKLRGQPTGEPCDVISLHDRRK